ncbi:hypothetical protein [Brachybacterium epidermidis]|uniref:hypothetical protein n=1 Tax=Brachybacterium epidermidis TaxID=2781983 RepID=UPI00398EE6B1
MSSPSPDALGPRLHHLGTWTEMPQGSAVLFRAVILAILALSTLTSVALGAVLLVAAVRDPLPGGGREALLAYVVPLMVFVVLSILAVLLALAEYVRIGVGIHRDGLTVRQPWFQRLVIPFAEVTALHPPTGPGAGRRFRIEREGTAEVVVKRLSIPPRPPRGDGNASGSTRPTPHPDVARALEAYADWCEHHGRTPRIGG